jgi:hypothetical protein
MKLTKGRAVLLFFQILATVLFISSVGRVAGQPALSWIVPLALLILIVVNSVWFSRFASWLIFAGSFFSFLVLLSAFTMRWRLEKNFDAAPFYRSMIMYIAMVYVSLGQIKILGGSSSRPSATG